MVATTIHLMRHGEVHNPDGRALRTAARLPALRARALAMADMVGAAHLAGAASRPARRRRRDRLPAAARAGDGRAHRRRVRPRRSRTDERHHRGGQPLRGHDVRRRRRLAAPPRALAVPAQPVPAVLGRAVHGAGRPHARRRRRRARELARGHEAVLVSHQLPVWVTRLALENRHLWHDPRKRQCSVASLTSLRYEGDTLVGIGYSEPAARAAARAPRRSRGPDVRGRALAVAAPSPLLLLAGCTPGRPATTPTTSPTRATSPATAARRPGPRATATGPLELSRHRLRGHRAGRRRLAGRRRRAQHLVRQLPAVPRRGARPRRPGHRLRGRRRARAGHQPHRRRRHRAGVRATFDGALPEPRGHRRDRDRGPAGHRCRSTRCRRRSCSTATGKVAGRILGLADPSTLRSMVDELARPSRRPRS